MDRNQAFSRLVRLAFTLVLVGYLMVWLRQPVAGLSFIGQEMGEWVKFLPQVRSGEIAPGRDLFFLPPVTLSTLMLLWSANWSDRYWNTWIFRGIAILISLLAAPPIEVVRFEGSDQWLTRGLMLGLVFIMAFIGPFWKRLSKRIRGRLSAILFLSLGLAGGLLPVWTFFSLRPTITELFRVPVGIGMGIWVSIAGNMLIVLAGLSLLFRSGADKDPPGKLPQTPKDDA